MYIDWVYHNNLAYNMYYTHSPNYKCLKILIYISTYVYTEIMYIGKLDTKYINLYNIYKPKPTYVTLHKYKDMLLVV